MVKAKRLPLTSEEKEFVFSMMSEATSKGLALETVKMELAETLDASPYTIHNTYAKMRAERNKQSKSDMSPRVGKVSLESKLEEQETLELEETEVNRREQEQIVQVSPPTSSIDPYELINAQTKVLLSRIEELLKERDEWKLQAGKLEEENKKIKEKFLNSILSN